MKAIGNQSSNSWFSSESGARSYRFATCSSDLSSIWRNIHTVLMVRRRSEIIFHVGFRINIMGRSARVDGFNVSDPSVAGEVMSNI